MFNYRKSTTTNALFYFPVNRRWTYPLRKGKHAIHASRLRWGSQNPKDPVESMGSREVLLSEVLLLPWLRLASQIKRYPAVALPFPVRWCPGLLREPCRRRLRHEGVDAHCFPSWRLPLHRICSRSKRVRCQRLWLLLLLWLSGRILVDHLSDLRLTSSPTAHSLQCNNFRGDIIK